MAQLCNYCGHRLCDAGAAVAAADDEKDLTEQEIKETIHSVRFIQLLCQV